MSTREETSTTFKVKVNLVEVRAVVRDARGNAVGNLQQEDFQLTDNGKPQVITKFFMEQAGAKPVAKRPNAATDLDDAAPGLPLRYLIFLFDDIHLKFGDLAQVRMRVGVICKPCGPQTGLPSLPRLARRNSTSPTTVTSCMTP